jgi:hypothetical protein
MEMEKDRRLEEIIISGEKSPTSPDNKGVKGWFKTKFGRRMSKGKNVEAKDIKEDKPFIDGAALTDNGNKGIEQANKSKGKEVAHAEDPTMEDKVSETVGEERIGRRRLRPSSVSSVSSLSEDQQPGKDVTQDEGARDLFDEECPPPPLSVSSKPTASPVRDSRFHEEM